MTNYNEYRTAISISAYEKTNLSVIPVLHNAWQKLHCIALNDTNLIYFFPSIKAFKHRHTIIFHLFLSIRFQTTDSHGCHRAESTRTAQSHAVLTLQHPCNEL